MIDVSRSYLDLFYFVKGHDIYYFLAWTVFNRTDGSVPNRWQFLKCVEIVLF